MPDFVHLHNHSDFSLLDGAATISKLVDRAKSYGMKALALTDHGNMFGVLRFYKECKANDINPIIGSEFYIAPGSRFVKSGSDDTSKYYHMVLLAKNYEGYKNLMVLSSAGYTEGFYYKPRIDDEILAQYSKDIICLSACLAGEIPQKLLKGQYEKAKEKALYYNSLFGEGNYYLELQDHGIPEQKIVNEQLIKLHKETGIPLVVTNDIHYADKDDANAQDTMLCIGTNRKKKETNRMSFDGTEFYMKSPEEMAALFPEYPEAISNTVRIAESCSIELELPGPLLPDYEIPESFDTVDEYLRHLTYEGLKERYTEIPQEIKDRADYELGIIIGMGFTGYFLIVWDFINYAKENDIPVGPGRGSGAGSIVAYAMKITDIDPLKYNLLFERFLNPERVSMPDFDIDFCFERRGEVIDYVTQKYGSDKVGQIITFGTLKPKAVIKDVCRVLDIPFAESNMISKLIPDGPKVKLKSALDEEPKLKNLMDQGGVYKELIETGLKLEGLNRHTSTHAAGVVIGKTTLTDYVPLYRDPKTGAISTQFTMDQLEECGLVKMDFLGLKTLTLIKNTEKLIQMGINPDFDSDSISEHDKKTYKMLGDGKSTCVFQFESSGMQKILRDAQPGNIEDLIALNALYRPGPMANIPQFVDSKQGRQPISYPHPSLEEILKPTYGVIVYQEQVMQVVQIIGGFSLGKADILRRAMGKKKVKDMEKMKVDFLKGAADKGISEKKASEIFDMLEPFAGYGFNKSHAAAYSVLAYKTAYLRANYPAEFMAANLTNEINSTEKLAYYISECDEMGIEILPPNINLSDKYFTVVDGKIVYGMMGIKGIGSAAVDEIIKARNEGGPFQSMEDLMERVELKTVNKKVIEVGILCGLFDSLKHNRATFLHNLELLTEQTINKKDSKKYGQSGLFDTCEEEVFPDFIYEEKEELSKQEMLDHEKEIIGFYFSGHPMDEYKEEWEKRCNLDLSKADRANEQKQYNLVGMLKTFRTIVTKKGSKMAFAQLEDYRGHIEVIFFSKVFEAHEELLREGAILGIKGTVDHSRGEPKFKAEEVTNPSGLEEKPATELHITLRQGEHNEEDLVGLRDILISNTGACQVFLHYKKEDTDYVIKASPSITVGASNQILDEITKQEGVENAWSR
ncbi:DNA polymerase III subunit alpha [Spirochaeta cellobiosiphila]|uniref:DNA polymerase III subunit alpha n=1 Tax=Spirochaeta cellobiosiphila TaxID=504483 RepID=UPI00041A629D|nr:DNA polymerase III subunit alpha [Spirochaeta cellobiosiphila]